MLEAKGRTGQIAFDGSIVTLTRRGFRAKVLVGAGDKRIPVSAITAVQLKPASLLVGYIQLTLAGGVERRSKFGKTTSDAMHDENSVAFGMNSNEAFKQIADAITAAIVLHRGAPSAMPSAANVPEQIRQLADLRAQGLISETEYEGKRQELLRRM